MSSHPPLGRRIAPTLAGLAVLVCAVFVLALGGPGEGRADDSQGHDHAAIVAADAKADHKQDRFHDAMRKLWEDHITWTRLAIISFAHDLPDLPATQDRLLANQVDIGNAIKPYYGRAAGNQLTSLLQEHITGAVALLGAAKAGDQDLVAERSAEWYVNGREIADFLHDANPRYWPRKALRAMMKGHLDQTLSEAVHRLEGDYAADVRDYDEIHHHILAMADTLSRGIVKQFPRRFR
jgi:hypothetical protein